MYRTRALGFVLSVTALRLSSNSIRPVPVEHLFWRQPPRGQQLERYQSKHAQFRNHEGLRGSTESNSSTYCDTCCSSNTYTPDSSVSQPRADRSTRPTPRSYSENSTVERRGDSGTVVRRGNPLARFERRRDGHVLHPSVRGDAGQVDSRVNRLVSGGLSRRLVGVSLTLREI